MTMGTIIPLTSAINPILPELLNDEYSVKMLLSSAMQLQIMHIYFIIPFGHRPPKFQLYKTEVIW